jgi:hypothetical protein
MLDPILTIAIPTYNRPGPLRETLTSLFNQVGIDRCKVLVVDNCSESRMQDEVGDFGRAAHVSFVRNRANVGLGGNVLRCMELAETPWLWILADDDELAPGAVPGIFSLLEPEPEFDICFMGLPSAKRPSDLLSGIRDFVNAIDLFDRLGFLSTGLYRTASIQRLLNVGYNYAYTLFPFIAMVITGIQEQGWKIKFVSHVPVAPTHKAQKQWTWILSTHGLLLAELIEDRDASRNFAAIVGRWALGPVGLLHDYSMRRAQGSRGHPLLALKHRLSLVGWVPRYAVAAKLAAAFAALLPPRVLYRALEITRNFIGKGERNKRGGEDVFGQV